jgi:hypothetical protein
VLWHDPGAWAFSGKLHYWFLGGDLPPEITWGRRALAMAYKWLSGVRRSVIDVASASCLTIEKAPPSDHIHAVEVRPALRTSSGA